MTLPPLLFLFPDTTNASRSLLLIGEPPTVALAEFLNDVEQLIGDAETRFAASSDSEANRSPAD